MVSSPHRLVSSMKGGEQILSSGTEETVSQPTSHPGPASWGRPPPGGHPQCPCSPDLTPKLHSRV